MRVEMEVAEFFVQTLHYFNYCNAADERKSAYFSSPVFTTAFIHIYIERPLAHSLLSYDLPNICKIN